MELEVLPQTAMLTTPGARATLQEAVRLAFMERGRLRVAVTYTALKLTQEVLMQDLQIPHTGSLQEAWLG
jgi:hypothetical protein